MSPTATAPRPASVQRPTAPAPKRPPILTRAETVECTCPDACERDHTDE